MGIYLNPGYKSFEEAYNSRIFVDKTEMILHINSVVRTKQKYVAVSRPRRFGKSYAVDMLCAYFGQVQDEQPDGENSVSLRDDLFHKCKLSGHEGWDRYLGSFDVIRLVMTDFFKEGKDVSEALVQITTRILDDLNEEYPGVKYDPKDLFYSLEKFYRKTGKAFVIIIDEWDAIFRENKEDKNGQKRYLDFLRDWMKDRSYIALAYMTGILPIKKYGEHSALNMFTEYSMMAPRQLAEYTGFTETEVRDQCKEYKMQYDDVSSWYDGYIVSDNIPVDKREAYRDGTYTGHKIAIYCPLSVVESMTTGVIKNYWNKTESYEALADFIKMDYDGLKDAVALLMDGGRLAIDTSTYQNDMTTFTGRDDVLSLLVHLGYLGFDDETNEVFIPNKEILEEFRTSTKTGEWVEAFRSFKISKELLNAIWKCDESKTAELMELAHDRAGNKTYNDEAALSYGIQYALYAAQKYYTTIQELDTGKGYADLVYLPSPKYPDKPALLVELKYDKSVKTAADQIRDRNYPQKLEHYQGNLLLISVNYNKDAVSAEEGYKRHECRIERY